MIDIELPHYIQMICHMSFHKIGYLDIQHALSESRSSEKEATHPTRRASFGKLKTENMMCSYNRKQKK